MINFYSESIPFTLKNKIKIRNWILAAFKKEKKNSDAISFIFCNDSFLLKLNKSYLNHDYYTDIITFDYTQNADLKKYRLRDLKISTNLQINKSTNPISGDIFISIQRVKDNAMKFDKTFLNELHRVIIHGVLHLIGYNDTNDQEKKLMTSKEDYYLSLLEI